VQEKSKLSDFGLSRGGGKYLDRAIPFSTILSSRACRTTKKGHEKGAKLQFRRLSGASRWSGNVFEPDLRGLLGGHDQKGFTRC